MPNAAAFDPAKVKSLLASGAAFREQVPPLIVRTTLLVPMTVLKVGVVKFAAKAFGTGLSIPMSKPKLAMGTNSLLILRVFGMFIYAFLFSR